MATEAKSEAKSEAKTEATTEAKKEDLNIKPGDAIAAVSVVAHSDDEDEPVQAAENTENVEETNN